MNCANCGKEISGNAISEDGYSFCNTMCRYEWRKNGKPDPHKSARDRGVHQSAAQVDLDFHIEPLGFENRKMMVRPSYWHGPKLFLDSKELAQLKKKIFYKTREYVATSNFGKTVSIRLRRRHLDSIPILEIDGQRFPIGRPLRAW